MKIGASILLVLAAHSALAQTGRRNIVVDRPSSGPTALPFSDAVLQGNTLYLSGQVGVDPKTLTPPASVEEETRLVMDGIKQTLEAAGMTMDDLVMVNVLCTDLDLFKQFNSVYRTYFHGGFPARTFTGATKLLFGAHFEVTGIAVRPAQH